MLKNGGHLKIGDLMQMRLNVSGHLDIRCTARMVRKADATGAYPSGMGIVFEDIAPNDRRVLRDLAAR